MNGNREKPTILIVDDNQNICVSIRDVFSDYCTVISANDSEQARQSLLENKVDLVILDYELEHMVNGLQLVPDIRRDKPEMPIILMTGYGSESVARDALTTVSRK